MRQHLALIIIALGGLALTAGDLIMRKWVTTLDTRLYAAGLVVWFIGLNFLAQSLRYKSIAVASILLVLFNVITLLAVTTMLYKEKLSPLTLAGIGLGLLSVVLMEYGTA